MGDRRRAGRGRGRRGNLRGTICDPGGGSPSAPARRRRDHHAASLDWSPGHDGGSAMKTAILLAALAQAAFGQFALSRLDGEVERAAGAVCDLGPSYPGEARTARFRLRNASAEPAVVTTLSVNG